MKKPSYDELQERIRELEKAESDRQKIREALSKGEEKYHNLADNIPVGLFRSTPGPKGRFIDVNRAFLGMLGYSDKRQLFEMNVSEIFLNPADRQRYNKKLAASGRLKNEELKLKKKDGTPIIVSETAIAIKNLKGKILFFNGIVEDVTGRKKMEEELRLQKTYMEELFNSAPEAIVLHDNKDRVIDINAEFTKLFGFTRAEAKGKKINKLVAPANHKQDAAALSKAVINGKRVEAESIRKCRDGSLVDVSILGAPIFHEGKQIGVYAIYRDISNRKKAEQDLLLQKTYLEILFNSAPEAIALHDNNDLIANINIEFSKLFGYSREDAIGKPINDLLATPQLQEEAIRVSEKVMRGETVELDTQRKRKDGTLVDVSILGAPIIHEGKQIADYAIYRDITERKKAQQELLIQKSYIESLFNSAPEAIVLHDNEDRVVNVNLEFTKMFGYTHKEAIGSPINELVAPPDLRDEAAGYSQAVINGDRVEAESVRQRKDGTRFDVSILGAPVVFEGKQMGVYAIYRDISDRKKAEGLREESRMARNIQINLLPQSNPKLRGYDLAGKTVPAMNVGGDYFDFISIDKHRIAVCLGDVSGKGLAASLVMSNLQATIRGQTLLDSGAGDCLGRANNLLFKSTDARTFISLFYGILDTRNHSLTYANAGQNMPFLVSPGKKPVSLKTRGIALGMKENSYYKEESVSLTKGNSLFIYSDGISEAMNKKLEEFGEKRLLKIAAAQLGKPAAAQIHNIFSAVHAHFGGAEQNDDMTMILLMRKPIRKKKQ